MQVRGKGIAERVNATSGKPVYYMPHQAVIRESGITTKLRVAFDASFHDSHANSLNFCFESGPSLNPDIMTLISNF